MQRFLRFLFIGLLTAAIGEWQFSVFLRHDLDNFIGSLAFNALYLIIVFLFTQPLLNTLRNPPRFFLLYGIGVGMIGLMVEWFLIGNSPWGNPQASQVGMFAYWASLVVVPLVFLLDLHLLKSLIVRYGFAYTLLVIFGQFLISTPELRYAFHIYTFLLGYSGLIGRIFWVVIQM